MQRPLLALLALLLLVPTAVAAAEVKAMGGFFEPATLDVLVNEEIVFTNDDSMPHTVTSTWDSGASFDAILRNGESFTWTFTEPGTYEIHCRPHAYPKEGGGMEGMVMTIQASAVVEEAAVKGAPGATAALVALALVGAALLARR